MPNSSTTPHLPLPRIAIVGRPNVGKSSLLNLLARDKVSIVDNTAGTTRDRVSVVVNLEPPLAIRSSDTHNQPRNLKAEVTDTGGYGVYVVEGRRFDDVGSDLTSLTDDIEFQIAEAVKNADIVLMVVDTQAGITAHDQTIARILRERVWGRKTSKASDQDVNRKIRILIVSNKCDGPRWEAHALEAAGLGFGEPIPVSAKNNYFRRDFLDRLYDEVAQVHTEQLAHASAFVSNQPQNTGVKFAIIGKRNAGKSSLVNALAGQKRVIVSEIAGTTRDAIDVRFEIDGKVFTAIDTAGLRKKKSFADRIEWWAFDRAVRAIERADVSLLLVDATIPVSQVDQHLAQIVKASHKPAVIVVNKWDLVEGKSATAGKNKGKRITGELFEEYLRQEFKGLWFAPIVLISAQAGANLRSLISTALEVHNQSSQRIGTGKLNRILRHILSTRGPSSKLGTFAKAYYIAQVAVNPPTIAIVVNKPELFTINYQKFLLNAIREQSPFPEVPIKLVIKARQRARLEDLAQGIEQEQYERRGVISRSDQTHAVDPHDHEIPGPSSSDHDSIFDANFSKDEEAALLAEFDNDLNTRQSQASIAEDASSDQSPSNDSDLPALADQDDAFESDFDFDDDVDDAELTPQRPDDSSLGNNLEPEIETTSNPRLSSKTRPTRSSSSAQPVSQTRRSPSHKTNRTAKSKNSPRAKNKTSKNKKIASPRSRSSASNKTSASARSIKKKRSHRSNRSK